MAYLAFTRNILNEKPISTTDAMAIGEGLTGEFYYIEDIAAGCVPALDSAEKRMRSGGWKRGPARYRVYNLGNTALVDILERHLGAKAKMEVVDMQGNGDVPFALANVSQSAAELSYRLKRYEWYPSYYGYNPRSEYAREAEEALPAVGTAKSL